MTAIPAPRSIALRAILFAIGGSAFLTINDVAVKFLSGGYPLHQVILARSLVAGLVLFAVIWVSGTGLAQLRTRRLAEHLVRIALVLSSNVLFFLGLAALPLADGAAIGFVAPLLVTAMSVVFLGERVGPHRWAAVGTGLLGVIVMTRPGSGAIQPAALLVLGSAACYAGGHMMTRRMRTTESAITLNFYTLSGFVAASTLMGLIAGDGRWGGSADPSLDFLLRAWAWPAPGDLPAFLIVGLAIGGGGLMIAQAYRLGEAGLVSPFEYVAMPLAILWGVVIFGTWPDATAWLGMTLIVGAGLYALWRETRARRRG